jgi:low affinity Fe/Cu permease
MSLNFRSASSSSARFARAYPIATGLISLAGVFATMIAIVVVYWTQLDHFHVPKILEMTLGWFVAVSTTLGIALLLMWVNDQREVNRSRRAIRLNFDHALIAMLDLAHHFTTADERALIGPSIEAAQKQIIAASARLKRYETRLTAFPPEALNAYADLENEIDVALEELNDLHRKLRTERDGRLARFGFDLLDRVARFDEFLSVIDARPTQASLAFESFTLTEEPLSPADSATTENAILVRRA